jgi:hypothetical protein
MWQAIGKIFGSGEVISNGLKLIDDIHTSKEEEILAKNQAKINLLEAYAPFKIAQRYLAIMFTVTFLLSFVLVLTMTMLGKGDIDAVKLVLGDFYIGEIMLTIVFFYFGGGAVEGFLSKRVKK